MMPLGNSTFTILSYVYYVLYQEVRALKRSYKKNRPTRELILQTGMRLFLENGYSATHCSTITKKLNISPGNLTFYFPTKEHLLAELVEDLCNFQWKVIEEANDEGKSSLFAYCMEFATMAALCEQSSIAKDFYLSAYTHPIPLAIIRKNDIQKAQQIFGQYCPDFSDEDFACTENMISGIEYAMLANDPNDSIPIDKRIRCALDCILGLYHVPEELRNVKIEKVLAHDYYRNGIDLLHQFSQYVDSVNEQAVKNAIEYKAHHSS